MIFEKPSLRTRGHRSRSAWSSSGGAAVNLAPGDIRLGERESARDIAKNLERWVDLIMARTFLHQSVVDLAAGARVPVMNGLSDLHHPCRCSPTASRCSSTGAVSAAARRFIGDGNNMVHSWMDAAARLGFDFALAARRLRARPDDRAEAGARTYRHARRRGGRARRGRHLHGRVDEHGPGGRGESAPARVRAVSGERGVVGLARKDAIVDALPPCHRGEEITDDVLDGPQSVVFDQAENRLHVQKAIMVWRSDWQAAEKLALR
jgi:ornithine carbamoyltransferase